jgi:hypothetical protein
MSKYLSCLVVVLTGIACGGTTDSGDGSDGGTSAGGSSGTGHGGSSSAGKSSGGSVSTGGAGSGSGGTGSGGVIMNGGATTGGFGGATFDPRCPPHLPSGACAATDTGLKCEYDNFTGCLCYTSQPGSFGICQKVDSTCTNAGGAASAAPPPDAGTGGISAKVALPPHEICSCNAATWTCNFGF